MDFRPEFKEEGDILSLGIERESSSLIKICLIQKYQKRGDEEKKQGLLPHWIEHNLEKKTQTICFAVSVLPLGRFELQIAKKIEEKSGASLITRQIVIEEKKGKKQARFDGEMEVHSFSKEQIRSHFQNLLYCSVNCQEARVEIRND